MLLNCRYSVASILDAYAALIDMPERRRRVVLREIRKAMKP